MAAVDNQGQPLATPPHERPLPAGEALDERLPDPARLPELLLYSHSSLFYWWPVWVTGYAMALVTWLQGGEVRLDEARRLVTSLTSTPGLLFTCVLLGVILITNVRIRGMASLAVVLGLAFMTVLFAWAGWWDDIFSAIPYLAIHLNLGFYLVFSTALLVIWLLAFLVFDRMTYWRVRPGQITEEYLIGGGEKSYDTRGMLFEQHGDDFFRHIVLGLGAGDLKLMTTGAKRETIEIENVLFANRKVQRIQRLVAIKPDDALAAMRH
ncbi:MAG: hypothetical protein AB7O57_16840 [Hyphomicrobiaceae bacterium]